MEPKHKRSSFGLYEMALLKENPYTHEVRARQISFTAEFKRIFWVRYQAGEYIPGIFESLGYDPEVLGIARMYSLASNLRKCVAEGREFTSGYTNRAKSHRRAEKTPAPDTSAMQHELTYLRQQVEFLKKITELGGHEPLDFLHIHHDRLRQMQQPHMDTANALGVAPELVCLQNQGKVLLVPLLPRPPYILCIHPTVISGTRHASDPAQLRNTQHIISTILDAFTKQVLAYVLSPSLELDFVLETVHILIQKHGVSLDAQTLVHSDQGCHYTSLRFIQILKDSSLRQSMSRRGNCWDNAPQESFFGHMKDEIDLSECETFDQVKAVIDDWIDYYNNDRYQWQLAKLSPNEFYRYLLSGVYPLLGKPSSDVKLDPI